MKYVDFNDSEFPLVKVTFNFENPSLEDYKLFLEGQIKYLSLKKPYVVYMDARKVGYLSSEIRIAQGKHFKEYKQQMETYCIAAVLLVKSPFVNMMLKAISVIAKPPGETFITSNEEIAMNKVNQFLSKINHLVY